MNSRIEYVRKWRKAHPGYHAKRMACLRLRRKEELSQSEETRDQSLQITVTMTPDQYLLWTQLQEQLQKEK
jgi:hypothetical protein